MALARINNGAENSHQPTRERQRRMCRFRLPAHTSAFLERFGPIRGHFALKLYVLGESHYRAQLARQFASWQRCTTLILE
jgi:putative transposase